MHIRKILSLLMVVIMVFTTMGSSFATYYDEYPNASDVRISGIYYQQIQYQNGNGYGNGNGNGNAYAYGRRGYYKNVIRFAVKWNNIYQYSFDNENWYGNCNQSYRTFYIREDYYDRTQTPGVEVVLPKSVNVVFLYAKDYSGNVKVFKYKLSSSDLEFIYGSNSVPQNIINVTEAIEQLPTKENLKLSDESKLLNARSAYDALGVDKVWVYNAHRLYELETRLDELKTELIDWTKVYKDIDNNAPGKLTEQYYEVPNKLYADLYVKADKSRIYSKKIGDGPRYNNADISVDVYNDTTPSSNKVFFLYDFSHQVTGGKYTPAMAKKVWGFFLPPESGKYQFKITSDDGHTWVMYLDDGKKLQNEGLKILDASTTITNKYDLHNISEFTTNSFDLKARTPYPLFIEYFNHGGNAALKLQYRVLKDNGTTSSWVEMKGGMFKPSKSYEFGFMAGNPAELQKAINEAQLLVDQYNNAAKIGTQEGQVSQAALNELLQKLATAQAELAKAIDGKLTQSQIDQAEDALRLAIEAFKNAIVKKPNGVSAPFSAQDGNQLLVAFDKDTNVTTYEIIISADSTLSSDDKVYKVTNGNFVLNGSNQIAVKEGDLDGYLKKIDNAKPNGRYSFNIPLGDLATRSSVTVFIRTATGDNKGDAVANTIGLLKQPTKFLYAVTDNQVIFYTGEKPGATGFAIDYYATNSTEKTRIYLVASGKDYVVLPKDSVDLTKISSAELYAIKLDNGSQNFTGGHSTALSDPKKIDIPSVENLRITIENGQYRLDWTPFSGALGYEVFTGQSQDVSQMQRWIGNNQTTNVSGLSLNSIDKRYFAVRAIVNSDQYSRSGFSNIVTVFKPSSPELYKPSVDGAVKLLTPPETANYVIKGDGESKGYYIITMPRELLNLTTALDVVKDSAGDFIVDFTEAMDEKIAFKNLAPISFSDVSESTTSTLVSYKVPFNRVDVGFTIQAIKNKLTAETASQISITKYVQGMTVPNNWSLGATYKIGDRVNYEGSVYECIQAHTVHAENWSPNINPALWKLIHQGNPDENALEGISNPTNVAINVNVTPKDVVKKVDIKSNAFASISGNTISSTLGAEFEIEYTFQLKSQAIYKPNFVFEFVENAYFSYDYPNVVAEISDSNSSEPLVFHTEVTKNSSTNITSVTLITDNQAASTNGAPFNFSGKDVKVTLKIKPTMKSNTDIMKFATSDKMGDDKITSKESWKLAYIIDKIKDDSGVKVMSGLQLKTHVDFDTLEVNLGSTKNETIQLEPLTLEFKPLKEIKTSH